jgi:hypothetical protein
VIIGAWLALRSAEGEIHVLPNGDLSGHDCSRGCWCRPIDDDGVIVHHAKDQRERREVN